MNICEKKHSNTTSSKCRYTKTSLRYGKISQKYHRYNQLSDENNIENLQFKMIKLTTHSSITQNQIFSFSLIILATFPFFFLLLFLFLLLPCCCVGFILGTKKTFFDLTYKKYPMAWATKTKTFFKNERWISP